MKLSELPQGAELVVGADAIVGAYEQLAMAIQPLVDRHPCVLIGLLLGGLVTLVEVATRLRGDFLLDVCHVGRYQGRDSGGQLEWHSFPRCNLTGQTVVLVDDICDEGITLDAVRDYCRRVGAVDVKIAVLVQKVRPDFSPVTKPEFIGLKVDDRYVFGCGMDLRGRWRHLPALYALRTGSW